MKGSASRPSSATKKLGHQAGHKGHVARQSIKLGDNYAGLRSLRNGQRCRQLGARVDGVASPRRNTNTAIGTFKLIAHLQFTKASGKTAQGRAGRFMRLPGKTGNGPYNG
jgi:hypothetical protein